MENTKKWKPKSYSDIHTYSTEQEVFAWLQPKAGEKILDLGCGTGDLTNQIAQAGAWVEGIDSSIEMIEEAKSRYQEIPFQVADARYYKGATRYDAIFSCAVLHWISDARTVARQIYQNLLANGRFVAQFAAKGNVQRVFQVVEEVLKETGVSLQDRNHLYFPSMGEYTSLLEEEGFIVRKALHFKQPTNLVGGADGFRNWIQITMDHFFEGFSNEEKENLYQAVEDRLRPELYCLEKNQWHIDYVALRVYAEKSEVKYLY
ncbi:class I SAM-dependent methyltransferase [Seinonella peptonophila]|nr:class I SAM-dependent methyltransferase [Seinonella peptonophila]